LRVPNNPLGEYRSLMSSECVCEVLVQNTKDIYTD